MVTCTVYVKYRSSESRFNYRNILIELEKWLDPRCLVTSRLTFSIVRCLESPGCFFLWNHVFWLREGSYLDYHLYIYCERIKSSFCLVMEIIIARQDLGTVQYSCKNKPLLQTAEWTHTRIWYIQTSFVMRAFTLMRCVG